MNKGQELVPDEGSPIRVTQLPLNQVPSTNPITASGPLSKDEVSERFWQAAWQNPARLDSQLQSLRQGQSPAPISQQNPLERRAVRINNQQQLKF